MRLFVAIDIPLKEQFLGIKLPSEVRRVNDFHITLKFIGNAEPDKIIKSLKTIKFNPFSFTVKGIDYFPNQNRISVVWLAVEPQDELIALHNKIDIALENKEPHFIPHITLARVKHLEDKEGFLSSMAKVAINKQVRVTSFKLYNSTLTSEGPVYEELFTFR